jgi:hypothetical protein
MGPAHRMLWQQLRGSMEFDNCIRWRLRREPELWWYKSNAHANCNSDTDRETNSNANSNGKANRNADTDGETHGDANPNGKTNGNAHADCKADGDTHSDSNSYAWNGNVSGWSRSSEQYAEAELQWHCCLE